MKKSIFTLLLCALMLLTGLPITASAFLVGDVNSDGKINAADARLTLRVAAGLENFTDEQDKIADVSCDGYITAADDRLILRAAAGLEELHTHTPGAAPTCTSAQICTVCQTELAPALEHNYSSEVIPPKYEDNICKWCGKGDPSKLCAWENGCTEFALSGKKYCRDHKCLECNSATASEEVSFCKNHGCRTCGTVVTSGRRYCYDHGCYVCGGYKGNDDSIYCVSHRCRVDGCTYGRYSEFYCRSHSCYFPGCNLQEEEGSMYCFYHARYR